MPITLGDLAREIIVAIEQADTAEKVAEAAIESRDSHADRVDMLKSTLRNELLGREDPANAVQVGGVVVKGCTRDVTVLRLADANRPLKDQDAARKMRVSAEIDTASFESVQTRDPVEPQPHHYDKEFLRWIRNRLVTAHGENPHVDYILRLDELIRRTRT